MSAIFICSFTQIPPALQRNPAAGAAAGSAGGQPARFAPAFPALHLGGGRDPRLPLHPGRLLANLLRRQVAGAGNQPFSAQFSAHALFRLLVRASSTSATPASAPGCPSSPSHSECRTFRTLRASPSISGAPSIAGHGPHEFWGLGGGGGLLHKVCTLLQWDREARAGGGQNPDPVRDRYGAKKKKSPLIIIRSCMPSVRMQAEAALDGKSRSYAAASSARLLLLLLLLREDLFRQRRG